MKLSVEKTLLPLAVIMLFIVAQSCNQKKKQGEVHIEQHEKNQGEHKGNHEHAEEQEHTEEHDHAGFELEELTLNNGEKWQADKPTNRNAENLLAIGNRFSKKDHRTLEDYRTFGSEVEAGINKMIRECTMRGEPDVALHIWFFPILEGAESLKEANNAEGLEEVSSEMIKRMRIYDDFFEYNE